MRTTVILNDLNRRKVLRVRAAYLVVGLGTIYAANVILSRLGLPEWTVTLVIVLVGVGFPLALGLAWACPFLAPLRGIDEFSRIREESRRLQEVFDRELAAIDVDDRVGQSR